MARKKLVKPPASAMQRANAAEAASQPITQTTSATTVGITTGPQTGPRWDVSVSETDPRAGKFYNYYTGEWVNSEDDIKPRLGTIGNESGGGSILVTEEDYANQYDEDGSDGGDGGDNGDGNDNSDIFDLINTLRDRIAELEGIDSAAAAQAEEDANAAEDAAKQTKRQSAIDVLSARFKEYGLEGLIPDIIKFATEGYSEDTITLELQKTDAYQKRFRANAERIKKGLRVLEPGEYIGMEDNYRQLLRAYGLKQFDNDDYVSQFIANDVSQAELSSRVVTAVQRVQNADPAVSKVLRDFYGIGQTDLVAYILDPNQQLPKIERQVGAAEIGAAARRQGLEAGVNVAEQLAAQGVDQARAERGYATIADILPEASRLSAIYGGTMDTYGQAEAEQEEFNQLASAQRKRRRLIGRETAAFSGQSGVNRTSLTQQPTAGQL